MFKNQGRVAKGIIAVETLFYVWMIYLFYSVFPSLTEVKGYDSVSLKILFWMLSFEFFFSILNYIAVLLDSETVPCNWWFQKISRDWAPWRWVLIVYGILVFSISFIIFGSFIPLSVVPFILHVIIPIIVICIFDIDIDIKNFFKGNWQKDLPIFIGRLSLTSVIFAIGIFLTVLLIRSGIFDNSAIIIGFIPIPGVIFSLTPAAVAAVISILLIRNKM